MTIKQWRKKHPWLELLAAVLFAVPLVLIAATLFYSGWYVALLGLKYLGWLGYPACFLLGVFVAKRVYRRQP